MPENNDIMPEGESSITKEKPESHTEQASPETFASVPAPEELSAVMAELRAADNAPDMLGMPDEPSESSDIDTDEGEAEPESESQIEGQIDVLELDPAESEDEPEESDSDSLEEAPEQLTMDIGEGDEENPTGEPKRKYDPKNPRKIDSVFEFVELFVFTFLAVMVISAFFFRHSEVEGSSMENALHDGDHLIISDFLYTPERGDIIVCSDYSTELKVPIVKRVIGIAGDIVKIDSDGSVYLNGELLDEDYVYFSSVFPAYKPGEWQVDEGEVFVMGDHRNVSYDSREIGTVSVDSILGKVLLRFYPFDKFGTVE